ncbi:MAG TPA: HDIG domain-containing protein [Candidatus Methanomethylophilaceae archaeon]|nr:HDIG domain-containing protein [Candidatus Methanomethylophilaceae archaeon]
MSEIPNERKCISILKNAGCSPRIILHCRTVKAVADIISENIPEADLDLVSSGALLHDLGRARDHTIMHAVIGAIMAEELGLPSEIVEIIRRHTGAGLDQQDIDEFGMPPGDYFPRTIEQKIVAEADNLVSDSILVSHHVAAEKLIWKDAPRGAERVYALHKELSEMAGFDLDKIVDIIGDRPLEEPRQRYGRGRS